MNYKAQIDLAAIVRNKLKNRWQKVIYRLWIAKLLNDYYYLKSGLDTSIIRGWLPVRALRGTWIGDCADRGLREAREHFPFHLIKKIHEWDCYGNKKRTYIYSLNCELTKEDWDQILDINRHYIYKG